MDSNLLLMASPEVVVTEKAITEDINEGINTVSCTELTPDPYYGYVDFNLKADQANSNPSDIITPYGRFGIAYDYPSNNYTTSITYPDLNILDEKNSPYCFSYQFDGGIRNCALQGFIDDSVYRHFLTINKSETLANSVLPVANTSNRKSIGTLLNQVNLNLKSIHFLVVFKLMYSIASKRIFLLNDSTSPTRGLIVTTLADGTLAAYVNVAGTWSDGAHICTSPLKLNCWYAMKVSLDNNNIVFEMVSLEDKKSISIYKNTDYSPTIKVNYGDQTAFDALTKTAPPYKLVWNIISNIPFMPHWNVFAIGDGTLNCPWGARINTGMSANTFTGNISVGFLATNLGINSVSIYDMLIGDTIDKQCSVPNLVYSPSASNNTIYTTPISSKAINPYPITYQSDFYKTFYGGSINYLRLQTTGISSVDFNQYTGFIYFTDLLLATSNMLPTSPNTFRIEISIRDNSTGITKYLAFQTENYTSPASISGAFSVIYGDSTTTSTAKILIDKKVYLSHVAQPAKLLIPSLLPVRIGFDVDIASDTLNVKLEIFSGKNYINALHQTTPFKISDYSDLAFFKNIPTNASIFIAINGASTTLINSTGVIGYKNGGSFSAITKNYSDPTPCRHKQFYYKDGTKSSYFSATELSNIDPLYGDVLIGAKYKPVAKETTNNVDILGKQRFMATNNGTYPNYTFSSSNIVKVADVGITPLFNNKKAFKFTSSPQGLKLDNHTFDQRGNALGNSPFCFECFIYPTNPYTTDFFGKGDAATVSGTSISGYFPSSLDFYTSGGNYFIPLNMSLPTNKWTHFALVRVKEVTAGTDHIRVFYDGVQFGSSLAITSTTTFNNTINPISIGQYAGVGYSGYLDEIRFTLGASRYYTTSFTPPTQTLSY